MWLEIVLGLLTLAVTVCLWVRLRYPWIKYDIKYILKAVGIGKMIKKKLESRDFAIDTFDRQVRERPKNVFLIYQDNEYSYELVDCKANQVARAILKLGLKAGDVAAIMMLNEPAFLWTFLGLQKIGVSASLINYHLRHKSLAHCITSCKPKLLISGEGEELTTALLEIKDNINDLKIITYDSQMIRSGFESMSALVDAETSDAVPFKHRAEVTSEDVASFIFTSGTTGLPKPAILTQRRTVLAMVAFSVFDICQEDVLYETLPLYHSAGLNLGVMAVINAGGKMVLRSKFSASNFWHDCRKHNVTVIHYIGEMCRYLVKRPKSEEDAQHSIRVAVGNGLRQDIWQEFQDRFHIPNVYEFYAATESPASFLNIFNKVGSVGRCSPVTQLLMPLTFVKFDHTSQKATRDDNGRCTRTGKNEIGLLICPINKVNKFDGYYDRPADNEKKILRDVFKPGDVFFNTGDLFHLDDEYFVYFQDRTGDTFRWKGENVSTNEVSNVLSSVDFIHDANVYGVTVPGCEGRAGMAAIHIKEGETLDSKGLGEITSHCEHELPAYARPKFLRVQRQMSLTTTFKQQKVDLINESFDPTKVDEPLYFFDSSSHKYEPITEETFQEIVKGKVAV